MAVVLKPEYLRYIRCLCVSDDRAEIFEILGAYMALITEPEYLRY
jgi:hypothetical protein